MKTKVSKKISSLVLALAIAITSVLSVPVVPVNAAEAEVITKGVVSKVTDVSLKGSALKGATVQYALSIATDADILLSEGGSVSTGETKSYTVDVPSANITYFQVAVAEPIAFQMKITNLSTDKVMLDGSDGYVSADDSDWEYYEGIWLNGFYGESLIPGQYRVELTFMETEVKPVLNQEKATITVGFTKKLSVTDGKAKSWSSSNKKVATVDKNGKVTAKKKGNAVITVKCTDGTTLKCKITVKVNEYTARKITTSDVSYGTTKLRPYKISFDKKGNLVIKARFVNKLSYRVVALEDIRLTVKDANGKTVGTFKQKKKSISVAPNATKDFTFTIKKSSLKKKKADLRNGSVEGENTAVYYY